MEEKEFIFNIIRKRAFTVMGDRNLKFDGEWFKKFLSMLIIEEKINACIESSVLNISDDFR